MKGILILLLIMSACGQRNDEISQLVNKDYTHAKSQFANAYIDHFPKAIESDSSMWATKTNLKNNDIGFFLYEFGLSSSKLDSIITSVTKLNILARYRSDDSCLLVLNALPNEECLNKPKVELELKQYFKSKCLIGKLPIPKFENYKEDIGMNMGMNNNLGHDFEIYVLEASHGIFYNGISIPNMRMPDQWKNGLSKGIAFNRVNKTFIYWTIMW